MEAINAQEREPAGEVIGVRIDDLAQQQLGSDRLSWVRSGRGRLAAGSVGMTLAACWIRQQEIPTLPFLTTNPGRKVGVLWS